MLQQAEMENEDEDMEKLEDQLRAEDFKVTSEDE